MNIAVVISSMQAGGAERLAGRLLNHFVAIGWKPTVFTFESANSKPYYHISDGVRYCPLGLASISRSFGEAILGNLRRIKFLRQELKRTKPTVILSFCTETNITTLLATRGLGMRVVVSDQIDPFAHKIGWSWRIGRRMLYSRADSVIAQTKSAAEFFPPSIKKHTKVIPNPVPQRKHAITVQRRFNRILAVGRLVPQKGFDWLLEAFACMHLEFPEWRLRIVGEGCERERLMQQARSLGVSDKVEMPGLIDDIEDEYDQAAIFVLSSRYEGFPNVLCEAMASGLPVVAFKSPGAIAEVIYHGKNGLLVDIGEIDSLATAIKTLIRSEQLRRTLGEAAAEITRRYSTESVFALWEQCLLDVPSA